MGLARRIVLGIIWFVVLYFLGCFGVGAIAGGIAGASIEPGQNAAEVGSKAGAAATQACLPLIALGALVLASVGSFLGFLPGTRPKKAQQPSDDIPGT